MTQLLPKDYIGQPVSISQGQNFKPWDRMGYTCIDVLPFLLGKPWDEVALGYVHALRPSRIRVLRQNECQQCDARTWRVTIYLGEDNETIESIIQEVGVGLPDFCKSGAALDSALENGVNSPQLEWENIDGATHLVCIPGQEAYYKITDDGKRIPYPKK